MAYNLTDDNWIEISELRGTFLNKSSLEDILLANSDNAPSLSYEDVERILPGRSKYLEVSVGKIYARTVKGGAILAVTGFSQSSNEPAIVPPELTEKLNEHTEQIQNLSDNEVIVYDNFGKGSLMVRIPKFFLDDVIDGAEHVIHPAFIVNGEIKNDIYISKYQNTVIDGKAYSLANKDPKVYTNFDQARSYCEAKGNGWHLMTNAEWAAIALWCKKMGLEPQGNNYSGVSYSNKLLGGVESYAWSNTYDWNGRAYKEDPTGTYFSTGRTYTGTSPVEFSHNRNSTGIFDLNGNVWEWVGGVRLVDGEIQVIQDNNASMTGIDQSSASTEWKAILQDGSLAAPGTADTLKFDNGSGVPKLNVLSAQAYKNIAFRDIVAEVGITIPELLKTLCLMPSGNTGGDRAYINTEGERIPLRGGNWNYSSTAGVFSLYLHYSRSSPGSSLGFRSAFVL